MSRAVTTSADGLIPTRYSLLSRLQDWDDQDSWKDFFDTYWRLIYSVAIKSGLTETEAEDAVQETIISVAKDIQKFKRDRQFGSFKGWLRNLARWRIKDQLRKRNRHQSPGTTHNDELPPHEKLADIPDSLDNESVWNEEWTRNLLEAAIERVKRRVKEEHFQIFELYVLKQWPVTKVARVLDVNIGQVYLAKHRIANLIAKEVRSLEEHWV